ncbi:MAG: CcmD family protein [Actinobacteria bacterium]|nr:CcmD family protein [Actinomycetota bacterium]
MNGTAYLAVGFGVLWLIVGWYLYWLGRRLVALERRLDRVDSAR